MVTNFNALARSYDYVVIDAGEAAGPEIDRISEVAPTPCSSPTRCERRHDFGAGSPAGVGICRCAILVAA